MLQRSRNVKEIGEHVCGALFRPVKRTEPSLVRFGLESVGTSRSDERLLHELSRNSVGRARIDDRWSSRRYLYEMNGGVMRWGPLLSADEMD